MSIFDDITGSKIGKAVFDPLNATGLFGGEDPETPGAAQTRGMAEGRALGSELMADPDLTESREGYKAQQKLTGPDKDIINQRASKEVEKMRYKGAKMSPMQQVEAQRKLAHDQGIQSFKQDQVKARNIYELDLKEAKFMGQMAMGGALAAVSAVEEKDKGFLNLG